MNWLKRSEVKVIKNELLSRHTSFKIGGPASWWVEPKDIAQLQSVISGCRKNKSKIRIIGAGSNILASDKKISAVVVNLCQPYFTAIKRQGNIIDAGAGVRLNRLMAYCTSNKLSGAEFLWGIPGTLAGALVMNAGAQAQAIGDLVESIRVMDYNGNIKQIKAAQARFSYRASGLGKYIILSARLKLRPCAKVSIENKIKDYKLYRLSTQDSRPSAGCVFKNPGSAAAGKLIDLCGLKGLACGQALISNKHANFIVNTGKASCRDVETLIRKAKLRVKKRFNIDLKLEIKLWH